MSTKPRRVIRLPAVKSKVGLERSAIYDLSGKGQFPRAVKLTPRAVGWFEDEIDAWLEQRAAERETKAAA